MVITRKIQVYVSEPDSELKKNYISTLYNWRNLIRHAANMIVAHKFVQQQARDFIYLKDEIQDKFYVKDIIKPGKGMSEQNITYRLISDLLKGKVPSDIYSSLNQSISGAFKETVKDINLGKASVRSYKNNIPLPFSAKAISNIHWDETDKRFYFTLFGIPMTTHLGRDRSNNQTIIENCISGEYKMCASSLQIDDNKKKMFLLLCVDIPKKNIKLVKDKTLYAFLSNDVPITCTLSINAKNDYDSGEKKIEIGTKEEFLYRRTQIQAAVRRCQKECRYNLGGKGRKRKLQAIERFHKKEDNYVETKLHTYSRMLVNLAVKYKCSVIHLINQKSQEDKAKEENEHGEPFLLRNWSYFGLKQKIEYKAAAFGIVLSQDKE